MNISASAVSPSPWIKLKFPTPQTQEPNLSPTIVLQLKFSHSKLIQSASAAPRSPPTSAQFQFPINLFNFAATR